jgi:mRNA deadenylase 3'-5' endonuclease subunit Ccr4
MSNNKSKSIVVVTSPTIVTLEFLDHNDKKRSLNRSANENISKTFLRLIKTFKTLGNDVQIELHNNSGQVTFSYDTSVLEAFKTSTLMIIHTSDAKESYLYDILINPPRVLNINYKNSFPPTVGWPILPTIKVNKTATNVFCCWYVEEECVYSTSDINANVYTPLPDHAGRKLSFSVIPSTTSHKGEPCTLNIGIIVQNPLHGKKIPAIERAIHCRTTNKSSISASTSTSSIRVMTYNLLANYYCQKSLKEGAMTYLSHSSVVKIDYRKQLILSEITECCPDILMLQECCPKLYNNFLLPHLTMAGYNGRLDLKTTKLEGCAIFYKKNSFNHVKSCSVPTKDSAIARLSSFNEDTMNDLISMNSIFQFMGLRHIDTQKILCVGNSHFYFHPRGEHIRLLQAQLMLLEMNDFTEEFDTNNCALLLAGDLNSTPETATIEHLRNGQLNKNTLNRLFVSGVTTEGISTATFENGSNGETKQTKETKESKRHGNFVVDWKKIINSGEHFMTSMEEFKHPYQFICSIDNCLENAPLTTNTELFDGTLDWIFIQSNRLAFSRIWPSLPLEKYHSLPNYLFPSDHIALVAEIAFT